MIKLTDIQLANFNAVQFIVLGDASSTVLKVNLTKPPFNLDFRGNLPSSKFLVDAGPKLTAVAILQTTADGDILTLTFSSPPPQAETVGINIAFTYDSLP